MIETDDATIAIFVHSPDRQFLNDTVLAQRVEDLGANLDAVERAYARRGVERYAVWVHESEAAVAHEVKSRGYAYDSSTRTMGMPIADLADVDTSVLDLVEPTPDQFWRLDGLDGLVPNLSAEGAARHRGLATALSAHAIERARERGCVTASLQSTEMAEGVYARVGFSDLGRFHEYKPIQASKEKE